MVKRKLTPKEELILSVITSKRRSMTAKQITEALKKEGVKISRPTVAKYLRFLKAKGYLKELKNGT